VIDFNLKFSAEFKVLEAQLEECRCIKSSYFDDSLKCGQAYRRLEAKLAALVESERESCAKIAEKYEPDEKQDYIMYASKEIRFRSKAAIKAAKVTP
jgi:hypothetical protein